ncbi:Os01g0878101, partial [Oryza sativa Japonica Group]
DECVLAWVVDGGRDAVEVAHLAATGIFVLELTRVATSSPSTVSPPPPPPGPL